MTKEYFVEVKQTIRVKVDLSNFTDNFMEEFRSYMYNFHTVEDHVKHLAYLYAVGAITSESFVEGYGRLDGIEFYEDEEEVDIIHEEEV